MPRVVTILFLFLISNAFGGLESRLEKIQQNFEVENPCSLREGEDIKLPPKASETLGNEDSAANDGNLLNSTSLSASLRPGDAIKYEGCEPENWDVIEIIMKRCYRFKVQVGIMDDKILAKPCPEKIYNKCYKLGSCNTPYGYHKREYEDLFFFKMCHCQDFDQTRMIDITGLLSPKVFNKILFAFKHQKAP